MEETDNGNLNIHKLFKTGFVSSSRPYIVVLREKFVVMHDRKARNPNEFPFGMVEYLYYTNHLVRLDA